MQKEKNNVIVETTQTVFRIVTFDSQGGERGSYPLSLAAEHGFGLGNRIPTPIRANHSFLGWWTAPTGGTQIFASTPITANITVFGRWQQIPQQAPISAFYMNQTDAPFSRIPFGNTTIGASGCGILSIAMIIARRQNATSEAAQVRIVEQIISSPGVLTGNVLSHTSTATVNGIRYNIRRSGSPAPSNFNDTVVQLRRLGPNGNDIFHFVLAVNNSLVKDPGRRTVSTMAQAENIWGTQHAWWSVN